MPDSPWPHVRLVPPEGALDRPASELTPGEIASTLADPKCRAWLRVTARMLRRAERAGSGSDPLDPNGSAMETMTQTGAVSSACVDRRPPFSVLNSVQPQDTTETTPVGESVSSE